jgi:hypothetical protein
LKRCRNFTIFARRRAQARQGFFLEEFMVARLAKNAFALLFLLAIIWIVANSL